MKCRSNPLGWGLIAALMVFMWNLVLFVVLVPAGMTDEYKRMGYVPTYYAGWPWSDLVLTAFGSAHALIRIQAVLAISIAINGALLGGCLHWLKWFLGKAKGVSF